MSTIYRQVPISLTGHTRPVVQLEFGPKNDEGFLLISACKDGKPMLREGDTGDWIGTFQGHSGAVWSSTLSQDSAMAATGAADFTAKLWDVESGKCLHSIPHDHIVKSVKFSSDGTKLLTASNEKLIRIFDVQRPDTAITTLEGHTGAMKNVAYMKADRQIISLSEDKTLRVWDPTLKYPNIHTMEFSNVPGDMELVACRDLLTVTYGNTIEVIDTNPSFNRLKKITLPCPVYSACFHPVEDTIVAGGEDFKLYKYSYTTGNELESYKGHFGPVHCVRFSPDGNLYASGSEDGTLRLWQNRVGQSYGLWKFPESAADIDMNGDSVKTEQLKA